MNQLNSTSEIENISPYESYIIEAIKKIDQDRRIGGSGYGELQSLYSGLCGVLDNENIREQYSKFEKEYKEHKKWAFNNIEQNHGYKHSEQRWWSPRNRQLALNKEMNIFEKPFVLVMKRLIIEQCNKAGILFKLKERGMRME